MRSPDPRPSPRPTRAIADGPLAGRVKGPAPMLAALAKAGITTTTALRRADLTALAKRTKIPVETLAALHLQAEIPGLAAAAAQALATRGGIRSRDALATANAELLARRVGSAVANPQDIGRWVAIARTGTVPVSPGASPPAAVRRALAPLIAAVKASSPHVTIVDPAGLLDPVFQTEAMARMRGLMLDAGIQEIAPLGTFSMDPSTVIRPGYHVARPTAKSAGSATAARKLESALLRHGRNRRRTVDVLPEALWFRQDHVTDAVIFGWSLSFSQPGELVLGREVRSLVIIVDTLNANVVRRIRYEDQDLAPDPQPPPNPARQSVGMPDNNPALFTPDEDDNGADGGDGPAGEPGNAGTPGDTLGAAPSITLYVKRTPGGLPDIDLTGRPGGDGGPGQNGGHGGDGSAGQPSKSVLFNCKRSVGPGGNGGRGGDGGNGGNGGKGATGGSVEIYTLADNLASLTGGELKLAGGPGGAGGDRGLGGDGGQGGQPGEARGVCREEPARVGRVGSAGASGRRGASGPAGESGAFLAAPIAETEWDAAFTQLRIIRLDPWEIQPGETVRIYAQNLVADTRIIYDGRDLAPGNQHETDLAAGTIAFDADGGGTMSVQLRAPDGNGGYVFSQQVYLRIRPVLRAITPNQVVPGVRLTLDAEGMKAGAVLLLGEKRLSIGGSAVDLPAREDNDIRDGSYDAVIVNPDGQTSNPVRIHFECNVAIRIKAWRVLSEANGTRGADRTDDDIRELFAGTHTVNSTWLPHGIRFRLDPVIGTARVSDDVARNFPTDDDTDDELDEASAALAELRGANDDGTFATFDPGAVNVYFVNRLPGSILAFGSPLGLAVQEDQTRKFPRWIDAAILAHEFGHVFGLDHVSDDNERNLMLADYGHNGTGLTGDQARTAFRNAFKWHSPE